MSKISDIVNDNTIHEFPCNDNTISEFPCNGDPHWTAKTWPEKEIKLDDGSYDVFKNALKIESNKYKKEKTEIKHGKEYVKNPPHYHSKCSEAEMQAIIKRINKRGYIEAIDVIDAFFKNNFNLASAFRYESRVGFKDDEVTELEKAKWYIDHEIEFRKSK